jgi:two-component system invasion response regulator UvrY
MDERTVLVAIAEDDDMVRAALRRYLSQEPGFSIVGECADGDEALQLVASTRVDVLLLDLSMPRRDGLAVLQEMRLVAPRTRAVVFTGDVHSAAAQKALSAGATACLRKGGDPQGIVRAVRQAMLP